MKRSIVSALVAVLIATTGLAGTSSPYAGQDERAVATLSPQDIDDLLAGRGWGFALAAELNGYPGPAHVLELADELALSDDQRRDVQAIFDAMNAAARVLGAELVAAETALSEAFGAGEIDPEQLQVLVARSAQIEADLRALHLAAHLETKPLMSRHQIVLYNGARGYDEGHGGGHAHE